MEFQIIVDGIDTAAAIVSVENLGDGRYGKICFVTGNQKYIDTIEKSSQGVQMLTKKFILNSEYTQYIPRDLNFENACYQAAVYKKIFILMPVLRDITSGLICHFCLYHTMTIIFSIVFILWRRT